MKVCVIGLGYVGLPLALQASSKGIEVSGTDKNAQLCRDLNRGISPIDDPFIQEKLKAFPFRASEEVSKADIYIICVPTPVDNEKEPDLSYVAAASESISRIVGDDELVIVESTIYPGVCEELVKPILEKSGRNYLLAHCPERINPGDPRWNVSNIPRVVAGIDGTSTERAAEFYRTILDAEIKELSHIRSAEAVKILENTFRDVNIAFVNEMAQSFYRLHIDIKEVIEGASTKPFGFMPHYPGIGVGGHCIAVDPYYMIKQGKINGFEHNFLIRARKINSKMPGFTMRIIQDELNCLGYPVKGTAITVLGLSYKKNVADDRESPAYQLIRLLEEKSADLTIYDPHLPEKSTARSLEEALKNCVCAVIATDHREFLIPGAYKNISLLIDGRNCLDRENLPEKIIYRGIGIR